MLSEGHRTFYGDDLLTPHVNMFSDLWNNVVLTHYPQPSRHMPRGMHKGSSHQPPRRSIPPLLSGSHSHYARQPPQMQHANIVLTQYVPSTRWDTAELFSQTLAINKLSDKRLWKREFARGPICHLEQRHKAQVRRCCLPSHCHLPAWKKTPQGDNCADATCHFLKLYYWQTVTTLVYVLKL